MTPPGETPPPQAPALHPFALPPDTTARFGLLIIAIIGACLYIYGALFFSVPSNAAAYQAAVAACGPEAGATLWRCVADLNRAQAGWMFSGVGLLAGAATLLFFSYPAWKLRRGRFVPLTSADAPEVVVALEELCRTAGLRHTPHFVWNPLNPLSSGVAFGHIGRSYVALSGGLVAEWYRNPDAFRAVVLHELAHLRNNDIPLTYTTMALWWAFILAGLSPFIAGLLNDDWWYRLSVGLRIAALTVLVLLVRNAVLHVREHAADARAVLLAGSTRDLDRVLATLPTAASAGWRKLWRVHPTPASRRNALADPHTLLAAGSWAPFAAGTAIGVGFAGVAQLLSSWLTPTVDLIWTSLLFALPAAAVVAPGVWRRTAAAFLRAERSVGNFRAGASLGLGILLGYWLAFPATIDSRLFPGASPASTLAAVVFSLFWSLVFVLGSGLWARWIAASANAWLALDAPPRTSRRALAGTTLVAAAVLALWLISYFQVRTAGMLMLESGEWPGLTILLAGITLLPPAVWVALQSGWVFGALLALWVVPLAAALRRSSAQIAPDWLWPLDSPAPSFGLQRQPLRPGRALLTGLAAGVVICVLLLLLRSAAWLLLDTATRDADGFRLGLYLAQVTLAGFGQALVAAIVAWRVSTLRVAHGMAAACSAGCLAAAGMLALSLVAGGTLNATVAWTTLSQTVNAGALSALVTAGLTAALLPASLPAPASQALPAQPDQQRRMTRVSASDS